MDFTGLLEPQKEHCKNLLDSIYINGVAIDQSDTGVGKTYCAAWIAKQLACPIVVVCPKPLMTNWKRTLEIFGLKSSIIINYEKLVRGNTPYLKYDLKKFHATPDWWLSHGVELNFRPDSFVIIDEEHKGRGQYSLVSDFIIALKNRQYKTLGLSASIAVSVADMKAFGYQTNLHTGKNYNIWCRDYGGSLNQFGGVNWSSANASFAQDGMREIRESLFDVQRIASRLTREQFGDLFPESEISAEVFDTGANTKKITAAYREMASELASLDKRSSNYKNHVFARMIKARRKIELLKTPTMAKWIEDVVEMGKSPVVFTNFNDTVSVLKQKLDLPKYRNKIGYLIGGQTEYERNRCIDDFAEDKLRIFIVNLAAGNLGISLNDRNGNFPRETLINPSWSAVFFVQAVGRIYRVLTKTKCIQTFFYANEPTEQKMANRLKIKLDNLGCLNDGDIMAEYEELIKK